MHVPVTLLHDGDFLDDLLKIRLHRNLFDGYDLPSFFIMGLKYAAVRPAGTQRERLNTVFQLLMTEINEQILVISKFNQTVSSHTREVARCSIITELK